jgi:mycothione reductase
MVAVVEELVTRFKSEAGKAGALVYEAASADDVCNYVLKVAREYEVRTAVESKSKTARTIKLRRHLEKAGIKTDEKGWIIVDDYLQTSQPNVWAFGDADGTYQFKHVANYESLVVYQNAVWKQGIKVDYHAVPHAIFTDPEIASVGLKEEDATERYGEENLLIGFQRYEDTAKGEAMDVRNCFTKVIVERNTLKILGAHIIGPHASVLIQEIVNLMYTPDQSAAPIIHGMHIHPALTEVVERAFHTLMPPVQYRHVIEEHYKLPLD